MTRPALSADSDAIRDAEHRAENAEHRVEELEARLEALENERPQTQSKTEGPLSESPEVQGPCSDPDAIADLRNEPMMDHLLNALDSGQDIGHYGRLVFAMIAHHFLTEEAMLSWLTKDPGVTQEQAIALLRQVEGRDYNPPRRDRILAWQSQQDFPILPNPDDPDCGNVYRNLKFPQSVYEHIQQYQEEKVQALGHTEETENSEQSSG